MQVLAIIITPLSNELFDPNKLGFKRVTRFKVGKHSDDY